jgi:hypothetical protein
LHNAVDFQTGRKIFILYEKENKETLRRYVNAKNSLQVHPPVLLILLPVPFSTGAHFCAVNPVLIYLSLVLI